LTLAHHLGRALQLTNILRDIDEDAGIGRLYLPRELLDAAGIQSSDPRTVAADPALPRVCAQIVDWAQMHFGKADDVMNGNPRKLVRAPRIMSEYYHAILDKVVARGFDPPRHPVKLSKAAKLSILLRYAFI
jgi:phytoene synthase